MKTRSVFFGFAVVSMLLVLSVAPCAAVKPVLPNAAELRLVEKTPVPEGPYTIVDGGTNGTFSYPNRGADLLFTVKDGLEATEYAMISYREPAEGEFLTTLHKVLRIKNATATGSIKMKIGSGAFLRKLVYNEYPTPTSNEYEGCGAKVWLVPASDLSINENRTAQFTAWNPAAYLFENNLITVGCPAPE